MKGRDHVRELIRKDQQRRAAIDALQSAISLGIESGEPRPFDTTDFKLRMRERHVVRKAADA